MKLCPKCIPDVTTICDFCRSYTFDADNEVGGWCDLHNRKESPESTCEEFACRRSAGNAGVIETSDEAQQRGNGHE